MRTQWKWGDRVHVYAYPEPGRGTVLGVCNNPDFIIVRLDTLPFEKDIDTFHVKQCRKLVKKEACRRMWLKPNYVGTTLLFETISFEPRDGWREFIEVKKK